MISIVEQRQEAPPDARGERVGTNGNGGETSQGWKTGESIYQAARFRASVRGGGARRKVGAPPLECNVWLERKIAPGEDILRSYYYLYKEWLERYHALRGFYPADPSRSFRAALSNCIIRLRRNGKRE